jgi:hypothetical protein
MEERGLPEKKINERLKGVKVEFQRQCLFGFHNLDRYPLWHTLKQSHPEFAHLVRNMNAYYGGRDFAIQLMKMEGKLFVDRVIPHLYREGIKVIGNHDGLIVRSCDAERTSQILAMHTEHELGFTPSLAIKGEGSKAVMQ